VRHPSHALSDCLSDRTPIASLIRWVIRSTELLRFFSGIDSRPPCAAVSSARYDATQATLGARYDASQATLGARYDASQATLGARYDASQATLGARALDTARSHSELSTADATAPSTASERHGERSPRRTDPCRVAPYRAPWTEPRRSGLGLVAALGAGHGYGRYDGEYSPRANGRSEAFGEDDEGCEPLIGGNQAQSPASSAGVIIGGGR